MELILKIALFAPPVLLAITLHEVAHGWAARSLGDPTAAQLGRLTLNPLKHIDPVGTVIVPAMLFLSGGFLFGWAKAVPVNMRLLNSPKRDMALVAVAGPASNLLMAIIWTLVIKFGLLIENQMLQFFIAGMAAIGIFINLILMVLNLIPFPPLDGSKVLSSMLPSHLSNFIYKFERYGLILFLGIFLLDINFQLGIFKNIVLVPTIAITAILASIFGAPVEEIVNLLNRLL